MRSASAQPDADADEPELGQPAGQPAGRVPTTTGIVAAMAGDSAHTTVLVGPSGQLYHPIDDSTWQRRVAGGVATDVRAAVSPGPGRFMIAGTQSPLYRSVDDVWQILRLPERGPVQLATDGGVPVLSVGRHVHVWMTDDWRRVARARSQPSALWASSNDRLYVARAGGGLDKWSKGGWSAVRHPLAQGDDIVGFAGRPGRTLYALAASGAILDISARDATLLPRAGDLATFTPHVLAVAKRGALWTVGQVSDAADAGAVRTVLATRSVTKGAGRGSGRAANELTLVDSLPTIAANDRATVLLVYNDDTMLLCTRAGTVLLRDTSGTWRDGRLQIVLPNPRSNPTLAPAHTR